MTSTSLFYFFILFISAVESFSHNTTPNKKVIVTGAGKFWTKNASF